MEMHIESTPEEASALLFGDPAKDDVEMVLQTNADGIYLNQQY
jgi:hypothetical protein